MTTSPDNETTGEPPDENASANTSEVSSDDRAAKAQEQTKTGRTERELPEIGKPQAKEGLDPERARGDHKS